MSEEGKAAMKKMPWSKEQLEELIPRLEAFLRDTEEAEPEEVRGLPPLDHDECLEYIARLMDSAESRTLTRREVFLHGQLLAQFEMAVIAKHLGKKGRFYVIPESRIRELMDLHGVGETP